MFGLPAYSVTTTTFCTADWKHTRTKSLQLHTYYRIRRASIVHMAIWALYYTHNMRIATIAKQSQKIKHKAMYTIKQNKTQKIIIIIKMYKELARYHLNSTHVQLPCFPSLRTLYVITLFYAAALFFAICLRNLKKKKLLCIIKRKILPLLKVDHAVLASREQYTFCSMLLWEDVWSIIELFN